MHIRTQINLLALGMVVLTAFTIVGVAIYEKMVLHDDVQEEIYHLADREAEKIVQNVYLMAKAMQASQEETMIHNLRVAEKIFHEAGPLFFKSQQVLWQARNQYSGKIVPVSLPAMGVGGALLGQNSDPQCPSLVVDEVTRLVGGTCTIFQRMNEEGDMLRAATTVVNDEGRRAVGTYIPRTNPDGKENPVIAKILNGETFVGRAYVVNDWYITAYQPLWDAGKHRIVGILYVGIKSKELEALRRSIMDIVVGKTGYVYVLGATGGERGCYLISKDGKRDGENIWEERDDAGRPFIQNIIGKALSLPRKASAATSVASERYPWKNPGESNPRSKKVAISYFAPWDWVICAGYYEDDYIDSHNHVASALDDMIAKVSHVAFLAILVALLFSTAVARSLSIPLEKAVDVFQAVGRGQLDQRLDLRGPVEIQGLSLAFDTMVSNLKKITASRDELNREIEVRIKAEQDHRESERRFQAIFNQTFQYMALLAPDGSVVELNQAARETFSSEIPLSPDTAFWEGPWLRDLSEDQQRVEQAVRQAAGGVFARVESAYAHTEDRLRYVDASFKPVANEDGEVVYLIAEGRDITERKATEQALRDNESRYRKLYLEFYGLLNAIPDTLTLISSDFKIIWTNEASKNTFYEKSGDPSGQFCYAVWHNRSEPCMDCLVARCFGSGRTEDQLVRTPNGCSWGIKAFPMRDEKGQIVSVIHLASDITEKIRMREETERSGRLASLGQLAAGVAHEINNPNALILHNIPILKETWADVEAILDEFQARNGDFPLGRLPYSRLRGQIPRMYEQTLESSRRIKGIVEDLKDFVRQGDRRVQEPVNINGVVEFALRLVANTIRCSTDSFSVDYGEDVPEFMGMPQRIEQVVINLIMNACQALPDRRCAVRVETLYDAERRMSLVRVRDEGDGIPQETLAHILEPFFTTKRQQGGTGLGLSIVASIIKDHRGTIDFDSTLGLGTTVTVAFPVIQETV